jgi:iron complex outermembrane receptor protein
MHNRNMKLALVAGAAAAATLATSAARAQEAATPQVGEIIVTAQKRSERLIDVPMSVSAVSGQTLKDIGIVSTVNLQQTTPGLVTVNTGFGFVPIIRGIHSSGTSPGDASNVAVYMDDISMGAPISGFFDLADIERIEVLKGPQGTLFGRNATGGAIRIVTRSPSFTTQGSVSADYGFSFKEIRTTGYLTGPITDQVAGSISATLRKGDGYIKGVGPDLGQKYGKPDNYLVRGKLLFKPNESFNAELEADKWSQQNDSVFISMVKNNAQPFPGTNAIPIGEGTYAGSTQPKADLKGWGTTLHANWDTGLSGITAKSITGYRKVQVKSQSDTDRTSWSSPVPVPPFPAASWNALNQYEKSFSEELNVSSASDQPLTWIAGAYYFHGNAGNPYFRQGTGDAVGLSGLGTIASNFTSNVKTDAIAGFGEATYNVTPQLHVTGGIRYSSEKKKFHWQNLVNLAAAPTNAQRTWNSWTYRGVVRYDLAQDANVYASISNGFKSGVYNAYSPLNAPVNPEKVTAYEVGAKARVGRILFTGAAYAYDYKDIQLNAYVTINGALLITLQNAATAKMRGVEFTAEGDLGGGFSFLTGVGFEPTRKYSKFTGAQVTVPLTAAEQAAANVATPGVNKKVVANYDASGSKVVRVPELTLNARLGYDADIYGGHFKANVNGSYESSKYWQAGNFSKEGGHLIINGRVGWTDTERKITYSIFGNNLTGEDYYTDYVANTRGDDSVKIAPGREVGVGVSLDF